ncbi:potassium channel family protein [Roseomonas alkaliterrae]|uniref:Voltage-gated potassium channel n=1 Tax=Neoroseomonas alkaliterrae TaxID=1452450 RepID=A0A840XJR6_9PROT|nr:potassium channel family protein [Neoroseomonas alkaliterrae]MBB5688845.1 voltage-gated potassium channel [Neoroseomonas alkaliterrae]MBR0677378.1 potassium channel family protein [Neoroseomonas alkaliterrae]
MAGPSALRARLHHLYYSTAPDARAWRYGVLAFDLATVLFVITSSFLPRGPVIGVIDVTIGIVALTEFIARITSSRRPGREALRLASLADVVAIASFLAPLAGEGFGFLRIFRTLRLIHSYRMLATLRDDFGFFRRHEDVFLAATHLVVFLFVMSALVYETQHRGNDQINHYADALYFTVTALTTTGFGDITLEGTTGRMISVMIMIAGVTLFLRLAHSLFRPRKVRFPCPACGLQRHDPDAVHCKACGTLLNIPDEGRD